MLFDVINSDGFGGNVPFSNMYKFGVLVSFMYFSVLSIFAILLLVISFIKSDNPSPFSMLKFL